MLRQRHPRDEASIQAVNASVLPSRNQAGRRCCVSLVTWLGLLLLVLASPLAALELAPGTDEYDLSPHAEVLHDPAALHTFDTVRDAEGWADLGTRSPVFGFAGGDFWFRTRISDTGHEERRWVYLISYALLDEIELHILRGDGRSEVRRSGDRTPFASRDLKHRHFNFLIELAPAESVELLLRVRTASSVQVPQYLLTREVFFARTHESQAGIGLYYGILLALLLFNLILWGSLREPVFGWYVLYVATFGVVQMNLNGLAFEYLWPEWPAWANHAMPLSMALGLATMTQFSRSFLNLAAQRPRLDRWFVGFIGLQIVMLAASPLLPYRSAVLVETASVFFIVPLILHVAISLTRSGYRPARWFLLAWSVLLVGTVAYAMVSFGLLPKWFITEYGIQIGSALELTLLSFALAYRIRDLEQEKARLIRVANDELEDKVEQRTRELETALAELATANQQLHEVSRRDGLTGVYNRRFLEQSIDLMWEASAEAGEPFSVLMFDIDHFKSINDRHGHLVGDDCLKAVADAVHACLRGPRECLARWGGEEFILLLPGVPLADARQRAEQVRQAVETRRQPPQGPRIELRVSVGVASAFPMRGTQVMALVEQADRALYRAKAAGRNRVELA